MKCSKCSKIKSDEELIKMVEELRSTYDKMIEEQKREKPKFCLVCETCHEIILTSNDL